jgi:hypothetical protein
MALYLDELDAKSIDYAVRVQIACAQAIIEAIHEQPRFTHWSGTATKPEDAASDATAAWEAQTKAYEIVRAEMDDLHKTLTVAGVPEQIPPFKAALAPAKARVLYLSARRDQLFNEAANLRERLDQFEAYAITVKSALDDRARAARYEAALRPFVDPESYSTSEIECRRNAEMDWCAVHSFRWPCPVGEARAALAGGGASVRERLGRDKTVPGHPGDPELL